MNSRSRGGDLESIDENDSVLSSSVSSSVNTMKTLLTQYYQQGSTSHHRKSKKSKQKTRSESDEHLIRSGGGVALEPLPNPLPRVADTSIGFKKILLSPSDAELLTFRVEEEEREEDPGRRRTSGTSLPSSSIREVVDCETPRVITWTDLTYDPTEYSLQTSQLEPIFLGPLSAYQTQQQQEDEEDNEDGINPGDVIATSRSDQSDYEADWDRASLKLQS
jgi:hypothetical protein